MDGGHGWFFHRVSGWCRMMDTGTKPRHRDLGSLPGLFLSSNELLPSAYTLGQPSPTLTTCAVRKESSKPFKTSCLVLSHLLLRPFLATGFYDSMTGKAPDSFQKGWCDFSEPWWEGSGGFIRREVTGVSHVVYGTLKSPASLTEKPI